MKRYKPGQFFYIVNRLRINYGPSEPILLEVVASNKKKTKKKKQPLSKIIFYTLITHNGTRNKEYVESYNGLNFNNDTVEKYFFKHSQLTSYINNNFLEPISEREAAKMMLSGGDKFYQSHAYNRLKVKRLLRK